MISGFLIVRDEEELLPYCLESFASLGDLLDVLSVVDNNSTDATLDILACWKDRLPLVVTHHDTDAHHGHMRNLALSKCDPHSPWIFYLDGDESITRGLADWLRSGDVERADVWDIMKYSTILDRYHHAGGEGPAQRLFRNLRGASFPQSIHTEPKHGEFRRKLLIPGVWAFDHTACKSDEGLWAKGIRYAWANRAGVEGVGPWHEYVGRVAAAHKRGNIWELPEDVRQAIFTGP